MSKGSNAPSPKSQLQKRYKRLYPPSIAILTNPTHTGPKIPRHGHPDIADGEANGEMENRARDLVEDGAEYGF